MDVLLEGDEVIKAIKNYVSEKLDIPNSEGDVVIRVYDNNSEEVLPDNYLTISAQLTVDLDSK